jgi:hypothetical protein
MRTSIRQYFDVLKHCVVAHNHILRYFIWITEIRRTDNVLVGAPQ